MVFNFQNSNQKLLNKKIFEEKLRSIKHKILSSTKNVSNYIDEAIKLFFKLLPDRKPYSDILSMRNSLEAGLLF